MNDAGLELLRAVGVRKTFADGDVRAVDGVDLRILAGEFVAITGPSGCGKSTLLAMLGTLERPTAGEIFWRGRSLETIRDLDALRALEIGFVFQSFHLLPTLTALENVQVPMLEGPWTSAERTRRAGELLDRVGLSKRRHHVSARLSIGERQRVAIARALANRPRLILADEPTGNLDSENTRHILDLFRELREEAGVTLVIVTHSVDVAAVAVRRIAMLDGRIQAQMYT